MGKWAYDTRDITCPVRIFQGEADLDVKVPAPATTDFLQRLIPHARIEIVAGFGHVCTNGPNEWTVASAHRRRRRGHAAARRRAAARGARALTPRAR